MEFELDTPHTRIGIIFIISFVLYAGYALTDDMIDGISYTAGIVNGLLLLLLLSDATITMWSKKTTPNYISNNFVKPRSILINFGTLILK